VKIPNGLQLDRGQPSANVALRIGNFCQLYAILGNIAFYPADGSIFNGSFEQIRSR
jgi:hypothetical protein